MAELKGFVLSFHPCIKADINILLAGKSLSKAQRDLVKRARAIILPQGCKGELYWFCRLHCKHVFPNYDCRFPGQGKVGDTLLFKLFGMPHPPTYVYLNIEGFYKMHTNLKGMPFSYPFLLKGNHDGEGSMVFLIKNETDLREKLALLGKNEGFILQKYIPIDRDLRVVIIGERRFYYWRIQKDKSEWQTNVRKGAVIDHEVSKAIKDGLNNLLERFYKVTGINLAAIDILYSDNRPLFLEINYYFGRRGLGGSERFYQLLNKAIEEWLSQIFQVKMA